MQFIENHTILFIILLYVFTILIQIIFSVISHWDDLKIGNILCPLGWYGDEIWTTIFGTYFPIINTIFTFILVIFGIYMWLEDLLDSIRDFDFFIKIKNFLNKKIK